MRSSQNVMRHLLDAGAASVAQHDARLIGERTRAALDAKRAKGIRLGRPVTLPAEVRERIAAERALGNTMRAIADGLNHDGIPTARGGSDWRSGTVGAVLASIEKDQEREAVLAALGEAHEPPSRLLDQSQRKPESSQGPGRTHSFGHLLYPTAGSFERSSRMKRMGLPPVQLTRGV